MVALMLSGCGAPNKLPPKTLEDTIAETVIYEIEDIIRLEYVNDLAVLIFTTPHKHPYGEPILAIGHAFFRGSEEIGWERIGPMGYDSVFGATIELISSHVTFDPELGLKGMLHACYGHIRDPDIKAVALKSQFEEEFFEAEIIETYSGRYYFIIGDFSILRGYSQDGQILYSIGSNEVLEHRSLIPHLCE